MILNKPKKTVAKKAPKKTYFGRPAVDSFLVVGLGNPEGKYFETYHNVGFKAAERLATKFGVEYKKVGNQMLAKFRLGDFDIFALKPLTYMNLSGQAVVAVVRKYNIKPANVFVFLDDLYIDKGNIRVSFGGSAGGHNGARSINDLLGTNEYTKIRIGIKPVVAPYNIAEYVLHRIDEQSRAKISEATTAACTAVVELIEGMSLTDVQSRFNRTNADAPE
jgi:PTH1 family peptidyl-tRNA hydrolase